MAERTPPTVAIKQAWIVGHPFRATTTVEGREAEFDRWLAAHDAELRAEVGRLRGVERGWQHDRAEWERERDEARQQLADLRTGIEALADTKPGATGRALRALLAGSGEQPGEADRAAARPSGQEGS